MARTKAGIYIFRFIPPPGKGGGNIYWKIWGLNMKGREMRRKGKSKRKGRKKAKNYAKLLERGEEYDFWFWGKYVPLQL